MEKLSKKYKETCIYKVFNKIATNSFFEFVIYTCIAINSITLSFDEYPISYEKAKFLEQTNFCVTLVFIAECIIKIIGLGIKSYAIDT